MTIQDDGTTPDQRANLGVAFGLDELVAAEQHVHSFMTPTPTLTWPLLSDYVGTETVVKHENCTPTGAFKVRGGFVFMDRLKRLRPHISGVISASVGNHGMSLAHSGQMAEVTVVMVVPANTDPERVAGLRSLGAEVVLEGVDFEAARQHSAVLAGQRGLELVPAFHPDLVLGVATYAKELFDASDPLDAVYVPIGMGSGICGMITTRDLLGLDTKVIGVCAEGAPAQQLSFRAGSVVTTPTVDTFASGVATRSPDPDAAAIIHAGAHDVVTVSDHDTADAVRALWATTHHLAEPAGAIAVAAAKLHPQSGPHGRVGVVLSGSSVGTESVSAILAGTLPA